MTCQGMDIEILDKLTREAKSVLVKVLQKKRTNKMKREKMRDGEILRNGLT